MKAFKLAAIMSSFLLCAAASGQEGHEHMMGREMSAKPDEKVPAKPTLKPAQGASVKIVSPKAGQVIKGDSVPLEFKMTKGKVGEHVHAYLDGEMVGMFKSAKGTLTGIKPGRHILELRVVTADHNTELDATDKVTFTTTR